MNLLKIQHPGGDVEFNLDEVAKMGNIEDLKATNLLQHDKHYEQVWAEAQKVKDVQVAEAVITKGKKK